MKDAGVFLILVVGILLLWIGGFLAGRYSKDDDIIRDCASTGIAPLGEVKIECEVVKK